MPTSRNIVRSVSDDASDFETNTADNDYEAPAAASYNFSLSSPENAHKETLISDEALMLRKKVKNAIEQGYTGDVCTECDNMTMVRNGVCLKCMTCGATTSCS